MMEKAMASVSNGRAACNGLRGRIGETGAASAEIWLDGGQIRVPVK